MAARGTARGTNARRSGASAPAAKRGRSCLGALPAPLAGACLLLALGASGMAQAQTTYVSNLDNGSSTTQALAVTNRVQPFTTGAQSGGYPLGSVEVKFDSITADSSLAVSIWSMTTGANPVPDAKLYDLTVPSITAASSSVVSFTPAGERTLSPSTTYGLALTNATGTAIVIRAADGNESVNEPGWSIGNGYRIEQSGGTWGQSNSPFLIAVKGPVDTTTDATLSALAVKDGAGDAVALSPEFASTTTSYTATVKNRMDRITFDPTKGHDDAEVNYFDGSDTQLSDADSGTPGFQADLDVGANTVKVKVTAEDNDTTQTYTVTVTREAAATGTGVTAKQITARVDGDQVGYCSSHLNGQFQGCGQGFGSIAADPNFSLDGRDYTIGAVLWYARTSDEENELGLTLDKEFPAARLSSVWLEVGGYTFPLADATRATQFNHLESYVWRPAPAGLRGVDDSTHVNVKLLATMSSASDATLRGLELTDPDDGSAIDLNEAFAPSTTAYTADVNNVDRITIVPSLTNATGSILWFDEDNMSLADADGTTDDFDLDLDLGENTVKVEVTAEDSFTTQTYTLVVTRTDTALSALDLTWDDSGAATDIPLNPSFDPGKTDYVASVPSAVSRITLMETKVNSGSTVTWLDASDMTLTDADTGTDGFQFDVSEGDNTVKVKVTAGSFTTTYTVLVKRPSATLVWDTTLTIGADSSGIRGFSSTALPSYGSLEDDAFEHPSGTEREVLALTAQSSTGVYFSTDSGGTAFTGLVLEWANEILPLDDATRTGNTFHWNQTWLDANAESLHEKNYRGTLPEHGTGTVCLRTASQNCPSTAVTPPTVVTIEADRDSALLRSGHDYDDDGVADGVVSWTLTRTGSNRRGADRAGDAHPGTHFSPLHEARPRRDLRRRLHDRAGGAEPLGFSRPGRFRALPGRAGGRERDADGDGVRRHGLFPGDGGFGRCDPGADHGRHRVANLRCRRARGSARIQAHLAHLRGRAAAVRYIRQPLDAGADSSGSGHRRRLRQHVCHRAVRDVGIHGGRDRVARREDAGDRHPGRRRGRARRAFQPRVGDLARTGRQRHIRQARRQPAARVRP